MAKTYIRYEQKKGFWISEYTFEIISDFVCKAFEKEGLKNKPEWYTDLYDDFDQIRLGHVQGYCVVLFEDRLAFETEREEKIIEVFEIAKKLIEKEGEMLTVNKLNQMQDIKDWPDTAVEWIGPLYTKDMLEVVEIMIKMMKKEWTESNYEPDFK